MRVAGPGRVGQGGGRPPDPKVHPPEAARSSRRRAGVLATVVWPWPPRPTGRWRATPRRPCTGPSGNPKGSAGSGFGGTRTGSAAVEEACFVQASGAVPVAGGEVPARASVRGNLLPLVLNAWPFWLEPLIPHLRNP